MAAQELLAMHLQPSRSGSAKGVMLKEKRQPAIKTMIKKNPRCPRRLEGVHTPLHSSLASTRLTCPKCRDAACGAVTAGESCGSRAFLAAQR